MKKISNFLKATSAIFAASGISLSTSFNYTTMSVNEKIINAMKKANIQFFPTDKPHVILINHENLLSLLDTNILPKSAIAKIDKELTKNAFLEVKQNKLYNYNFS